MESIFKFLSQILPSSGKFLFWGIWFVGIILLFLSFLSRKKLNWVSQQKYVLLAIYVPKENEKGPVAAEMMFASLHGIYKPTKKRFFKGELQEHISFEIASTNGRIGFFIWVPEHLKDFVEGQIYAQYPDVEIEQVKDYTEIDLEKKQVIGTELVLNKADFFPIKTFLDFEVDPLASITSVLGKLKENEEQIWIQMLVRPTGEEWQKKGLNYIDTIKAGGNPEAFGIGTFVGFLGKILGEITSLIAPGPPKEDSPAPVQLSSSQETQLTAIEENVARIGFETKIRIACISKKGQVVNPHLQSIIGTFKQFSTANLNGFKSDKTYSGADFLQQYKSRLFSNPGFVLNTDELASIFHLPTINVETPTIAWTRSKKGEPPDNSPIEGKVSPNELSLFAETNFRHIKQKFGIKNEDRSKHMYFIGKTGMGKSNVLKNMAISDIRSGKGIGVVDPHGDLIEEILDFIPSERMNDVIVFDPSDRKNPIAFNPLESVDPDYKGLVCSGLISIFQKIWAYSWGPRLEHILRNTLLALLDYPDSTMLSVNRMFVDKSFRKQVVKKITDLEVKRFWTQEFPGYQSNPRLVTEAISPIQNKVGQFLSSATIRNIIGQPKSTIDMRDVIDSGKILLIKLSQGAIGEDNSSLLGAMMISKLQLAAMSRVDTTQAERKDFYLYVDEFQNFATESFAKILSEARKYGLNLTVANQYIAQMSEEVRDAVFGNIGTLVCFRVGAADAQFLAKEFLPVFDETDIVNLNKFSIYLKLAIDGVTSPAFSADTLPPIKGENKNKEKVINLSRERYSSSKDIVEEKIARMMQTEETSEEKDENIETRNQHKEYKRKEYQRNKPKDTIRVAKYPEKRVTVTDILDEITEEEGMKKESSSASASDKASTYAKTTADKLEDKESTKDKEEKPSEEKKEVSANEIKKPAEISVEPITSPAPKEESQSIQTQGSKQKEKSTTHELKEGKEIKFNK